MIKPHLTEHDGLFVARDDLFPGGTKARFLPILFEGADEVVYASPAEGGAQTALATVAARLGKHATIFVAQRAQPHPRTLMARRLGAEIVQVSPGHLNVVQARARKYSQEHGAHLAPFGFDMPEAVDTIAEAARSIGLQPDEVWCAAGSGVLARGLAQAWPNARRHVVQVGRELSPTTWPAQQFTNIPRISNGRLRMRHHSQATLTTTRKRGSFAQPRRDRGACCSGTLPDRHSLNVA